MGLPLAIMAGAGLLGKLFGGAAQGSANQRAAENNQAAQRNQLLAQLYGINQNASMNALTAGSNERLAQGNQGLAQRGQQLNERQFALNAPSVRAGQSVRGSILQNAQPATLSGLPDRIASRVPTISGGLTPAMFNADTRALGGEMTRKALIDQLKGDEFSEFAPMQSTDFSKGVLSAPKLEEFQKSGLLEKILAGLGLAGSVAGGVGEAFGAAGAGGHRRALPDPENWGDDV